MSSFIGYEDIGVWVRDSERDDFLDWFAANRCQPHDTRWEFCKSDAHRWMGCCIQLDSIIPRGEFFLASEAELSAAGAELGQEIAQLLSIVGRITRGEWSHHVSSNESLNWRTA